MALARAAREKPPRTERPSRERLADDSQDAVGPGFSEHSRPLNARLLGILALAVLAVGATAADAAPTGARFELRSGRTTPHHAYFDGQRKIRTPRPPVRR